MVRPPPPPPDPAADRERAEARDDQPEPIAAPTGTPSLTEQGAVKVTLTSQIAWCEQELAQRRAAYPLMIQRGQLAPERAARDLALLACIIGSLRVFETSRSLLAPPPNHPPEIKPIVVWCASAEARTGLEALLREAMAEGQKERAHADPVSPAGQPPAARAASEIRRRKPRRA